MLLQKVVGVFPAGDAVVAAHVLLTHALEQRADEIGRVPPAEARRDRASSGSVRASGDVQGGRDENRRGRGIESGGRTGVARVEGGLTRGRHAVTRVSTPERV